MGAWWSKWKEESEECGGRSIEAWKETTYLVEMVVVGVGYTVGYLLH